MDGEAWQAAVQGVAKSRDATEQFHSFIHSGGPVVKNLTCNAEDTGSVPGQRTKIPHSVGKISHHITTTEASCCNY